MNALNLTPPRPVTSERRVLGTSTWSDEPPASRRAVRTPPSRSPKPWGAAASLGVALALVVAGGAFMGAPYRAADKLGRAMRDGDARALDEVVDFPALRESLKAEVATALQGSAASKGEDAQAQQAVSMFGAAFANAIIDAAVRPETVAQLKDLPVDESMRERMAFALKRARTSYDGPNRFTVRVLLIDVADEPFQIVLTRHHLVAWRVTSVKLPRTLSGLDDLPLAAWSNAMGPT